MSTETFHESTFEGESSYDQYRALSIAAVVALVLGLTSLPALLFPRMLFIPSAGLFIAVSAYRKTKRHADEFAGFGLARVGLVLNASILVLGGGYHLYTYGTEVPDGYQRVSFLQLQPVPERPNLPVSPESLDLDGKRVFLKGYVLSDEKDSDLKKFVLVPDLGSCCFGGSPKLTDMVEVTLRDPMRTRFSFFPCKVGGSLKVDPRPKASALEGAHYYLDADYLK